MVQIEKKRTVVKKFEDRELKKYVLLKLYFYSLIFAHKNLLEFFRIEIYRIYRICSISSVVERSPSRTAHVWLMCTVMPSCVAFPQRWRDIHVWDLLTCGGDIHVWRAHSRVEVTHVKRGHSRVGNV